MVVRSALKEQVFPEFLYEDQNENIQSPNTAFHVFLFKFVLKYSSF